MKTTSFYPGLVSSWRVPALLVALLSIAQSAALAGVYLSNYSFSSSSRPYVYTDEGLSTPYRLRVKIIDVPGYPDGFHAVNGWNNNFQTLESVPAPGVYNARLYWVRYMPDYSTIIQVGPESSYIIYVQASNQAPSTNALVVSSGSIVSGQSVTVTSFTYDLDSNLTSQAIDYVPPGGSWVSGTSGNGTRWDGSPAYSNQLNPTFQLTTVGTWQFRARGSDQYGLLSAFQYQNVAVSTALSVDISLDSTGLTTSQSTTARSSATPAGQVVYHGLEGRLVGDSWSNWCIWNDSGGAQQTHTVGPLATGNYEVRAYAAPASGVAVYSSSIFLTVSSGGSVPAIISHPQNQTASAGGSANFVVGATGSPVPAYQWQRYAGGYWSDLSNGGSYSGVTSTTLTVSSTTTGMNGDQFRCVVTNANGSTTSNPATLTVSGGSSSNGLNGQYFSGTDLSNVVWSGTVPVVDFDWGDGNPGYTGNDYFSARWIGYVQPQYSESYTFITTSDDGVRLWVNGQSLVDNWTNHAPTDDYGSITLTAGQFYTITMEFFENSGGAVAKLSWQSASQSREIIPQSRLYTSSIPPPSVSVNLSLDSTSLTTSQSTTARSTADPAGQVVYHGLEGRPVGGSWSNWRIWNDSGGSQQTHTVGPFATGNYEVRAYAAPASGTYLYSSSVFLTVGSGGSAPAIISHPQNQTATAGGSASFVVGATGSPAPAYQWQRYAGGYWSDLSNGGSYSGVTSTTLTVSSTTTGMNGDQFRCVATNANGSTTSNPATLTVSGGPSSNGLNGQYFSGTDLSNVAWSGTVPVVNFDWGNGNPGYTGNDYFSARWTGYVQPQYSENYTFITTSDDGVRLWVNGQLLIDNWTDHGPTDDYGSITLTAGQFYTITMEFFENSGGAVAKLSWQSPSQTREIIPQGRLYTTPGGGAVPVIISPIAASSEVGGYFGYQIAATNNPTVFNASPLPAGLSLNSSSGLISGYFYQSGVYDIELSAGNGYGSGAPSTLRVTVSVDETVVSPPAPTQTKSFWQDVNGDGILDEIISANDARVGLVLTVEDQGWDAELESNWFLGTTSDGQSVFPFFSWSLETLVVSPSDDPWSTLEVVFAPAPGEEYIVWADDQWGWNNNAALWPVSTINAQPRWTIVDLQNGALTVSVPGQRMHLSFLSKMTWYLIRLGGRTTQTGDGGFMRHVDAGFNFTGAEPIGRAAVETKAKEVIGVGTLTDKMRNVLDAGCIGLTKLAQMRRIYLLGQGNKEVFPGTPYPDDAATVPVFGEMKAFLTYADSELWSPSAGQIEVIYAKYGPWKDGVPPTPTGQYQEVPLDSVGNLTIVDPTTKRPTGTTNNYITKIGDKWVGILEGTGHSEAERATMQGYIYHSLADLPDRPHIFIKRLMPPHEWNP